MPQAYRLGDDQIGLQQLADTSATQNHAIGKIVRGKHDTYGEFEAIYLKGVANTIAGSTVNYDKDGNTALTVAGARGNVAVALSANVASQWGWYVVQGVVPVAVAAAVVSGANVYVTATAGKLDDAVVATDKIDGARFKTADGTPAANFALLQVARPAANGNG